MEQYLARATAPGAAAGPRPRSLRAAALLRRVLPAPVYLPAQRLAVKAMLRRRREVQCPLVTVSQVIQVRRSPPSAGKASPGGRAPRTDARARPGPGPGVAPGRLPEGRVRERLATHRKGRLRGPRHRRGLGAGAGSAAGHGPVPARPLRAGRRAARDGALQRVRARMNHPHSPNHNLHCLSTPTHIHSRRRGGPRRRRPTHVGRFTAGRSARGTSHPTPAASVRGRRAVRAPRSFRRTAA